MPLRDPVRYGRKISLRDPVSHAAARAGLENFHISPSGLRSSDIISE